nr:hypothetical protein [Tanacetum cinerariifolium]
MPEMLHPELPGPGDRIVDFPEGKTNASKDGMPVNGTYSVEAVRALDTHLPLLTLTASRVIEMDEPAVATDSSSILSAIEKSTLDFAHEDGASDQGTAAPEILPPKDVPATTAPGVGQAKESVATKPYVKEELDGGWMSFSKRSGKNTPQCYTKPLDSLKNLNNPFFWVDERVFLTVVDWRTNASKDGMPVNGEDWEPPPCPHEVPLLTLTASWVIEMDEPAVATDSSGVPSAIEKSPLDFAHEDGAFDQGTAALEMPPPEDVPANAAPGVGRDEEAVAAEPSVVRESRKRGHDGVDANAPPKSLRRDYADLRPSGSSHGGKSLAAMQLCLASNVFVSEGAPANVSDPDLLSMLTLHHTILLMLPRKSSQGIATVEDSESKNVSSPVEVGSPGSVYRPEWGVTNGSLLDTPEACQDLVDHAAPLAIGLQLCLRFEQEAKLLRKSVAQVARRDKRIEARELEIKNLEALLEAEADMKRAAEDKSVGLVKELEDMHAYFSDLQVSHGELSQQVASLKEQLDARPDALSIDFDEELYPYMLTAIAGRRWVVGHGLRLAMMKCAESLGMRQAFADVVSAGVVKGMSEGLKHGLEGLKDAPMDVIMAALYLESDTGGMPYNIYATSSPAPLSLLSPCTRRSDGVLVFVPTVVPQGLALLLVDAVT